MPSREKRKYYIATPMGAPPLASKVVSYTDRGGEHLPELSTSSKSGGERYFDRWVPIWDAIACELKDTSPPGNYIVTKILIAINVILFLPLLGYIYDPYKALEFFPSAICVLSLTCLREVFLSMFVHVDPIHLIGNMMFLYIVGDNVEISLGRIKFLIIYFSAGLMGAFIQSMYTIAFDIGRAYTIMVGASAAISGLIGAYLVLYPGSTMCWCMGFRFIFRCFRLKASNYLGLWILFQFVYPLIAYRIAVWAHLGGLVTGIVLAYLLADKERISKLRRQLATGRYRGLSPDPDELRQHSLSSLAVIALVLASIALLVIANMSYIRAQEIDGKYYTIYIKEKITRTTVDTFYTYHTDTSRRIIDVYGEISDETPQEEVVVDEHGYGDIYMRCYTKVVIRPLKTIWLYGLVPKVLLLYIIVHVLVVAAVYIAIKGYRQIEITYIPSSTSESQE